MKSRTVPERNVQQGGYTQTSLPGNSGISREFRVVRDNRVNQSIDTEAKPPLLQGLRSTNEQGAVIFTGKGYAHLAHTNFSVCLVIYIFFEFLPCLCYCYGLYCYAFLKLSSLLNLNGMMFLNLVQFNHL